MPVPTAVLEQDAAIEAKFREQQEAPAPEPEPQEGPPTAEEPEQTPQPVEVVETPEPEATQADAAAEIRAEVERIKHAHAVLQGKYNAEVPRLSAALKERERLVEELQTENARIQEQLEANAAPSDYGIPEEEYDETVVRMAERVSDSKTKQAMEAMQKKMQAVQNQLQAQTEAAFYAELARVVPDWEAVNADDGWLNWLGEKDRYTGVTRQVLLNDAFNAGDVIRVANFFEDFKGVSKTPVQQKAATAPSVSSQVVPRSTSAAPVASKPTISMAEWQERVQEVVSNRGNHTAEALRQIEADLDAAIREGRVTM